MAYEVKVNGHKANLQLRTLTLAEYTMKVLICQPERSSILLTKFQKDFLINKIKFQMQKKHYLCN